MAEHVPIEIEEPDRLVGKTATGERVGIGEPGDYKPCVAKLPSGELVLTAFVPGKVEAGPRYRPREDILFFRSDDGGATWTGPQNLTVEKRLRGREPFQTVLSDGTMLVTVHFLSGDLRNPAEYTQSYVHRSHDGGTTWTTVRAEPEGAKRGDMTCTTRNVLELRDGSLLLGVSANNELGNHIWRSFDGGRTWSERYSARVVGLSEQYPYPFLGEGVWWQAPSGKTYLVQRVDYRYTGLAEDKALDVEGYSDQYDRMFVYATEDEGRTLVPVAPVGGVGEMYPSILKLLDGRLLLTFTVRSLRRPLGLRAVLGEETGDGFHFDLQHDRFLLDTQTAPGVSSGGGFGCTVQLDDGTLVSSYSWRDAEHVTHMEVLRWKLPE